MSGCFSGLCRFKLMPITGGGLSEVITIMLRSREGIIAHV